MTKKSRRKIDAGSKPDGSYLGYEDFCVLNGFPAPTNTRADMKRGCSAVRANLSMSISTGAHLKTFSSSSYSIAPFGTETRT
jgi:hypothetical protein